MEDKAQQKGYISLLMLACQQGNIHQIQDLIAKTELENSTAPTNVLAVDQTGRTALHYCAEYSRFDCADFLLSNIPEGDVKKLIDIADHEGFTALLIAVINGNGPLLALLMQQGADINAQDKELHTPVHWATVCGHYNCLDLLLDRKAEASTPDIHGAYPIHYAAQMSTASPGGSATITRANSTASPSSPGLRPQQVATPLNQGFRFLQRLIEYGVPVSPLDLDRRQPLLWAASSGARDACALLVKSGSDAELGDKDGLTALHCAASRGHLECLKVLIEDWNARVDVKDKHECTPMMYAATLGFIDCIRYLHTCGAEKNHQDRKGRSAAHLAASKGQTESIMELEDLGGNIWLRNHRGDFPLHEAAQAGYIGVLEFLLSHTHTGVLEFLLSRKPDVINSTNNDGRSCLHIAAMQKDFALCQFLVENKINVNLVMHNTKRQYFTALDLSNAKNNMEMSRYLKANGALDALTVTGKAVSRIQKSFQQFSKEKRPAAEPRLDPNGILEEAFETGAQLSSQGGGMSRRASLRNNDVDEKGDLEDELVMLETDSSYMPHLPREVASSPTDIPTHLEQERRSDYDRIMDASVLGGLNPQFNASYGFPASQTEGRRRHSNTEPLFSIPAAAEKEETSAEEKSRSEQSLNLQIDARKSVDHSLLRQQSAGFSPKTPVLNFFPTTQVNGVPENHPPTRINSASPSPNMISRTATPVFEMSTLALNEDSAGFVKSASHHSLVTYDTDSGSDDDMKHPQHRSRFMRQLLSQNDMTYGASGSRYNPQLKRMSFSRSHNSFLVEPTPVNGRSAVPTRESDMDNPFAVPKDETLTDHMDNPFAVPRDETLTDVSDDETPDLALPTPAAPNHPTISAPSSLDKTTQATQMTPRPVRPVAHRDSASSPRVAPTKELETQTEQATVPNDEASDFRSRRSSSSISGIQTDKSDSRRPTSVSSAWDSSPVNGPVLAEGVGTPLVRDSGISARTAVVTEYGGVPNSARRRNSLALSSWSVTGGLKEMGELSTQTLPKQLNETEVQTTPRNIEFNNARSPLLSRRTRSASQESQTSARGLLLQRQANLSGLFTGDSREHKNSSSGDIESARLLSAYDDDTLPDNFVPPLGALVERRKSRLRWDETAGVMPDAVMIRNSGRRASFHADSITPEHRITFHMPSTMGGSEVRLKASDSVNEEPENEAAAEEEEDAKVDGNRVGGVKLRDDNRGDEQEEEEEEEHHTEMYKKFRPPTPRVPSLKELGHTSPEKKAKVAAKKKPPPVPVVARVRDTTMNKRAREEKQWEKKQREDKQREDRQREQKQLDNKWREDRTVVRTSPDQTVPVALKNLTTTMKRFSNAMALPHRDNGLPAMPAKFISSFNNTILDLAPRSVIVKYLDQLDRMSKKGTRYNEPVVLSRLIPKYQRDMESTGRPNPAIRDRRSLLTEIRSFNEWGQYLIEQLTNAVAPLNDLMVDGKISTEGSRIGSGASKSGTDNTLPDIDQSSTTGSSSTKGSPFFGSPLRPSSRNMGSMEAINGSPMVPRTNRAMTKSGSPKLATQSTADKDGLNKLPSLQHPFPWR